MLGAVTVFIIDRQFHRAAAFALGGAVLTFFGFIHGEAIGIARAPAVAFAYLCAAGMLLAFARQADPVIDAHPEPEGAD